MKSPQDESADAHRGASPPGGSAAELRRRAEERLQERQRPPQSANRNLQSAPDTQRLVHELQVHQIELEMQNAELRATQAGLEAALEQYTELYDFAPAGYFALAGDSKICQANLTGASLLGIERSQLLSRRFAGFVAAEARSAFGALLARAFETKAPQSGKVTLSIEGKPRLTVLLQASVSGDDQECRVVMTDLTECTEADEVFQLSQQRLSLQVEQTPLAVIEFDVEGRVREWNPAAVTIFGYSREEAIGEHWSFIVPAANRAQLDGVWASIIGQRGGNRSTNESITKDGRMISCEWFNTPLIGRDGRAIGVASLIQDVTERKRAEERLRQLAQVSAASSDYIALIGSDFRYRFVNDVYLKARRLRPEDIVGRHMQEIVGREKFEQLGRPQIEACLKGETVETYEWSDFGSGVQHFLHVKVAPFREPDGTISGAVMSGRDITERQRAEAALRQKEEYFQALIERATDFITVLEADGTIRYESPAAEQVYGYKGDELLGRSVFDLIHPEDRARARQALSESIGIPGSSARIEVRFRRKDSSWRVLEATTRNLLDDPNVKGIVVNSRDTTERKRLEEALRESSEFNQQIVASAQEGIIVHGLDLKYQVWNPFMEQLTGMSADQVLGKHPDELFPFLREAGVLVSIERALAGEPTSPIDVHFDGLPSGKSGWTSRTNDPLRNAAGEIIGAIEIVRDITERKRAELRIAAFAILGQRLSAARSPAEAARAIFASADEFWKWDSGVLDLQVPGSQQMRTALAYDLLDGQRREVLPADRVDIPSAVNRRVMAQGAELILRKPDEPPATDNIRFGDVSRLSASLMRVPVRVENQAVGVLSIQSYTPDAYTQEDLRTLQALADHCGGALDRLRTEALLRGSEVRYRRLFEAAKDGVLILDAETGMVVDANPFLVQLLGSSREALLGKKLWELGFFKDIVATEAGFETLRRETYIHYDDKPLKTADGRRIDVEFVSNVDQVDHHKMIQCNIRDITERKLTEWRELIYKDQLRALSARIEMMREEERTRISREIHDELGQMLTGIKMDLRWMEHRLDEFGEDRRVNPILDKLVAAAELTDATIKAVQRIAAELRPGMLDKLGLPITLQYEATRFEERTGIACRLVVPGEALPLRLEVATAFFRIFQEALTNVTRHAKATAVEAELQPEADGCRLEIRDNGQGMAGVDPTNLKSLGLLGMQERASSLGGGVSFAPRPGGGTVVTVRIPNRPTQRGGI